MVSAGCDTVFVTYRLIFFLFNLMYSLSSRYYSGMIRCQKILKEVSGWINTLRLWLEPSALSIIPWVESEISEM